MERADVADCKTGSSWDGLGEVVGSGCSVFTVFKSIGICEPDVTGSVGKAKECAVVLDGIVKGVNPSRGLRGSEVLAQGRSLAVTKLPGLGVTHKPASLCASSSSTFKFGSFEWTWWTGVSEGIANGVKPSRGLRESQVRAQGQSLEVTGGPGLGGVREPAKLVAS